jgi:formate-dependent nitrite reductase cytochrome c552 subunit
MFEGSLMAKAGTTCVDCHMPKIGYRTNKTKVKSKHWDTTSHTFMVAKPEATIQYGVRNSCATCHTEGKLKDNKLPLVPASANAFVKSRQALVRGLVDKTQTVMNEVKTALNAAKKSNARKGVIDAAEGKLARAAANVNLILLDGSMGFHNTPKAEALLKDAEALAKEAKNSLKGK